MSEMWMDVVGYPGYKVSNIGGVVSAKKTLKPFKSGKYLQVSLYKDGVLKAHSVHRLVAIAFIPNPYKKPEVNHIDGDGRNNTITNLEWVTSSEDRLHAAQVLETVKAWNKGKALVDRNRLCESCNQPYQYRKLHQRYCSNHCSQQARLVAKQEGHL